MNTRPSNSHPLQTETDIHTVTTISQALQGARHELQAYSSSPAVDAGILLCHVLACTSAHLIAWPEKELNAEQAMQFEQLVAQRKQGTPVAYLTGTREFWSLDFKVTPDVLIPRAETETLVEFIIETFSEQPSLNVVDLGTGSGAIACALARERPGWNITATDVSEQALVIAQHNATLNQVNIAEFVHGSWFEPIRDRQFDIIVSNPPYVAVNDPHLESGDLRFEPTSALTSGEQGMDDIRRLTQQAGACLKSGGWLILEHGFDQQQLVREAFGKSGFIDIIQRNDIAGLPRMSAAHKA